MTAAATLPVNYSESARRHFYDAGVLLRSERYANAGQLFGIATECGIKAILVACGVPVDTQGSIDQLPGVRGKGFKEHMPQLNQAVASLTSAIPDGRRATSYLSTMPNVTHFSDWLIEHRYWREAALPSDSVGRWQTAAGEVMATLDRAKEDGVLG